MESPVAVPAKRGQSLLAGAAAYTARDKGRVATRTQPPPSSRWPRAPGGGQEVGEAPAAPPLAPPPPGPGERAAPPPPSLPVLPGRGRGARRPHNTPPPALGATPLPSLLQTPPPPLPPPPPRPTLRSAPRLVGGARTVRAGGARCAVPVAASDPAAARAGSGSFPDAAGATLSAPRLPSAGTPTPRALCPVLPSPARLAPRLDMEGAAAPAARDGPNLGPGAPGSPSEAVAGATAAPAPAAAAEAAAAAPEPRKPHGVKRHHHKHNLKHRYELQETLGKGTYGKVKRATERFSGRVVSAGNSGAQGVGAGLPGLCWGRARVGRGSWALRLSGPREPLDRLLTLPLAPRDSGVFLSRNTCYILSAHILGVFIPAAK